MNNQATAASGDEKLSFGAWVKGYLRAPLFSVPVIAFLIFALYSGIHFALLGQIRNMVLGFLLLVIYLPVLYLIERFLHIRLPFFFVWMLLLLLAGGALLGPCFDYYFRFPHWDDWLHTLSGFLFSCLGCGVMCAVVKPKNARRFAFCVVIGIMICLALLMLWEMIEYAGTTFFNLDMQEDCLIYDFHSFYLAGTHNYVKTIGDITKTVITYDGGKELVLDGYLDIGLYDTLNDLLVGLIGAVFFGLVMLFNRICKGKLDRAMIPVLTLPDEETEAEETGKTDKR